MMNQVYRTLPDDRPITSLCIVEDIDKCPKGYIAVSRTHDQDSDADLWRESGFFGRKCTRYICLSKTEGTPDYVVQSLAIINEKEVPPQGYSTLTKTFDTAQKAWRKKQLCYKFAHKSTSPTAVTDIIVLSRMKKAPEEFSLSGEINGITVCYKIGKSCPDNGVPVHLQPQIPYSLLPLNRAVQATSPSSPTYQNVALPPRSSVSGSENGNDKHSGSDYPHDYEMLSPLTPSRPAPKPPTSSYATMSGCTGLEGVPFILNPKWSFLKDGVKGPALPRPKTKSQIDEEYSYEFRTERET